MLLTAIRSKLLALLAAGVCMVVPAHAQWKVSASGNLSPFPLDSISSVSPVTMFVYSDEYPTMLASAYNTAYDSSKTFYGYFDPMKCYSYNGGSSSFYPVSVKGSVNSGCAGGIPSNKFDGNFMNWATMTTVDGFRWALTGGDRVTDGTGGTVLRRAYMSDQAVSGDFAKKFANHMGTWYYINNQSKGYNVEIIPSSGTGVLKCLDATVNSTGSTILKCASADDFTYPAAADVASDGTAVGGNINKLNTSPVLFDSAGQAMGYIDLEGGTMADACMGTGEWQDEGTASSPLACLRGIGDRRTKVYKTNSAGKLMWTGCSKVTRTNCTCTDSSSGMQCNIQSCNEGTAITDSPTTTTAYNSNCVKNSGAIGSLPSHYTCSNVSTVSGCQPVVDTTKEYYLAVTGRTAVKTSGGKSYTSEYNVDYMKTGAAIAERYRVFVEACYSASMLESNCKTYSSGGVTSYKPTGLIQDYAEVMKFGLVAYYRKNDTDNAVLRAKAKWVGPNDGTMTSNGAKEWDSNGVFVSNPDSSTDSAYTSNRSGVIRYINYNDDWSINGGDRKTSVALGYSSSPTDFYRSSYYKGKDNIAKLYYTALRYLRHAGHFSDFDSGATFDNSDGFPTYTTWDDPYESFTCRNANIVVIGDANNWCDKRLPGNAFSTDNFNDCSPANSDGGAGPADSGFDVGTQTDDLGTQEGRSGLKSVGRGNGNSAAFYMAGMAYWANKSDIRTDLNNRQTVTTYVVDIQEYGGCSYDTGNNAFWLTAKYGGATGFSSTGAARGWSTQRFLEPAQCTANSAPPGYTVSSGGTVTWPKNLFPGGDPKKFRDSITAVFESINATSIFSAPISGTSTDLSTDTQIFIPTYQVKPSWQGDLIAKSIDADGTIGSTETWKASSSQPSYSSRVVYTYGTGGGGLLLANGSIGNMIWDQFKSDPTGSDDTDATNRMNWFKGDVSNEERNGGTLRNRIKCDMGTSTSTTTDNTTECAEATASSASYPFGDILGSSPAYVGAPVGTATLRGLSGYATFATNHANRTPMVYVGANDGMLHGFRASDGVEKLAYMPEAVAYKIRALSDPAYTHTYTVDGSPVVQDVCVSNCSSSSASWMTLLVGNLRAGGRGVYALNVTDPSNFTNSASNAASVVQWEFNAFEDQDLGFTFSDPKVRRFRNGKWGVIFGNGLNNTTAISYPARSPGMMNASSTGRNYIYILWVEGPDSSTHRWGTPCQIYASGTTCASDARYVKIELKAPSESGTPLNPPNGITQVAPVDVDGNGTIDYIYAADVAGYIWKIDVRPTDPSKWGMPLDTFSNPSVDVNSASTLSEWGSMSNPVPLFRAVDENDTPQSITGGLQVSAHPNGGYLVYFGTGSFAFTSDRLNTKTQSLYGIWDESRSRANAAQTLPVTRSNLQKQRFLASGTSGSNTYFLVSNCAPYYGNATTSGIRTTASGGSSSDDLANCPDNQTVTATQHGWVLNLELAERYVTDPILLYGSLQFSTSQKSGVSACDVGSTGKDLVLNYLTGGRLPYAAFTSAATSNVPLTLTFTGGSSTFSSAMPSGIKTSFGRSSGRTYRGRVGHAGNVTPPGSTGSVALGSTFVPGWGVPSLLGVSGCQYYVNVPDQNSAYRLCLRGLQGRAAWRNLQ